jgi:hypothetical protein
MLLRVIPTRPGLPRLVYLRFRSLPRATWPKAVNVVCGYIDEAFGDLTSQSPQTENYGGYSETGPNRAAASTSRQAVKRTLPDPPP